MCDVVTERERHDAIEVARDLCYGENVIEKLKRAKSIRELDNIMVQARKDS